MNTKCVLSLLHSINIPGCRTEIRLLPGKSNIHHSRSILLTEWYDKADDDDLFLFIDSDQTFQRSDIENIIKIGSDVTCGIYCNASGRPNCHPKNRTLFFTGKNQDLYYGATGFMLIRKPILKRVEKYIEKEHNGNCRFWISSKENNIIPFFKERFIKSELVSNSSPEWLGEDYSFCWLIRHCEGTLKGMITPTLGHEVAVVKTFYPSQYKSIKYDTDSIVYYSKEIDAESIDHLTKKWVERGFKVQVYGKSIKEECYGIEYFTTDRFNINNSYNILILGDICVLKDVKAEQLIIDYHGDINEDILQRFLGKIDNVIFKSDYHRSQLSYIPNDKVQIIPSGIEERFGSNVKKKNNKLIYTSGYNQGLEYILQWGYPEIKKHLPDIELHIYNNTSQTDKRLNHKLRGLLQQDGIFNYGKVSKDIVLKALKESMINYCLIYKSSTADSIMIKESINVKCIPIISNIGIPSESEGIRINGDPTKKETQLNAARKIVHILSNHDILKQFQAEIKEDIFTWTDIALRWIKLFKIENISTPVTI